MVKLDYISDKKTIHFIGIGGCGMSGLAKILAEKGFYVTGSDLKETTTTVKLKTLGCEVFFGHHETNIRKAHIVVVSSAIDPENPELKLAKLKKLPILKRAEMLAYLMQGATERIAVAGTHGKTTTSSYLTSVFDMAKCKPSFCIGAELLDYQSNAVLGSPDYFICEADESDGTFLELNPSSAILTNIEAEHMVYFGTYENLLDHFKQFCELVLNQNGMVFINRDDPVLMELVSDVKTRQTQCRFFSIHAPSSVQAKAITHHETGVHFELWIEEKLIGNIQLQLYGEHNVYNALGAIACAQHYGLPMDAIIKGLWKFTGTKRRLQKIGSHAGVDIYDDYAHHPTEIRTTLDGLKKSFDRRIVCIFQPHRYSRTRDLIQEFPTALDLADVVIVTDIYSAQEKKIPGITGALITEKMDPNKAHFIAQKSDVLKYLNTAVNPNDIVITMGAGDIHTLAREFFHQLLSKKTPVTETSN